jgi:hypothetical protein
VLKLRQNSQLPFPLEETDREFGWPLILGLATQIRRRPPDVLLSVPGSDCLWFVQVPRRMQIPIRRRLAATLLWQNLDHASPPFNVEEAS